MDTKQDAFEEDLERQLAALKDCQEQKKFASCLKCETIFECKTRKNYVEAVYKSMNKGNQGGFDF
ncbi:MAG: hypothetical protein ACTTIC_05480 [Helicobacteraceae bacterium]